MANQITPGMIVNVRLGETAARCQVYMIETPEDVRRRFGSLRTEIEARIYIASNIWPNLRVAWIGEPITLPESARAAGMQTATHQFPVLIAPEGGGEYRFLQLTGEELQLEVVANPANN
jgi:hypothetical protein